MTFENLFKSLMFSTFFSCSSLLAGCSTTTPPEQNNTPPNLQTQEKSTQPNTQIEEEKTKLSQQIQENNTQLKSQIKNNPKITSLEDLLDTLVTHPKIASLVNLLNTLVIEDRNTIFFCEEHKYRLIQKTLEKELTDERLAETITYVTTLSQYAKNETRRFFHIPNIADLYEAEIPLTTIFEMLSIKKPDGSPFFQEKDRYDFIHICKKKTPLEQIRKAAQILNTKEENFFDPSTLEIYLREGGSIEYAAQVVNIAKENGIPVPWFYHILKMQKLIPAELTIPAAKKVRNTEEPTDKYVIYSLLGCTQDELENFRDTQKPNANIIVSSYEMTYNIMWVSQSSNNNTKLFEQIRKEYDTYVTVVANKEEFYKALEQVPSTKLLLIVSHGLQNKIIFGKDKTTNDYEQFNEKYILSNKDDLKDKLNKIETDGTIVLYSCLTGKGGAEEDNLANHFKKNLPGRKIISAQEIVGPGMFNIISIKPFDAEFIIRDSDTERKVTYKTR